MQLCREVIEGVWRRHWWTRTERSDWTIEGLRRQAQVQVRFGRMEEEDGTVEIGKERWCVSE